MATRSTFASTSRAAHLAALVVSAACAAPRAAAPTSKPLELVVLDDAGRSISAAGLRGRVLIVHVFTTWSLPAEDDALRLDEAFAGDDRVTVLGVAIDEEAGSVLSAWRRGMKITYPIALATDEIRRGESGLGEARAVPFTLVFDRDGRLALRIDTPLGAAGIAVIRSRARLDK